ncbi:glycosyltransferase [Hymenobacter tibetensis]|uniref:Glycosyltransferase n=1 Tax=Hymenobacter tibetensis TaxID=497967 RepID=A0ABY4D0Q0_9BACT|nr:glycosyltransferase [Hymenobacter tibetensis]UOG76003.1 glycosyltransferase [Hymenobacter tibetensis]
MIVADGSGKVSEVMAAKCRENQWIYLPSDVQESFAQTYNKGMVVATGDYRVWLANDIFVTRGWDTALIKEIQRTGAWMAAPYLTFSDYSPQTRNITLKMPTFSPSAITLNLNMITRECYEKVGLLDDQFSGCFNDIDYMIRIRKAGGEVIITDAGQILHFGQATLHISTSVNYAQDASRFDAKYPFIPRQRDWYNGCEYLATSWLYKKLIKLRFFILDRNNANHVVHLSRLLAKIEPFIHKV